jgi:hypothetical protein
VHTCWLTTEQPSEPATSGRTAIGVPFTPFCGRDFRPNFLDVLPTAGPSGLMANAALDRTTHCYLL